MNVTRTKQVKTIKITAHGVNEGDQFVWKPDRTCIIYINNENMGRQTRHGLLFSGPIEIKVKKMRELAKVLTDVALIYEKHGEHTDQAAEGFRADSDEP